MERKRRVRYHTDDYSLDRIAASGYIVSSRGWGDVATGVNVEVEPFRTTRPGSPGKPGPKGDLGCAGEGAFVEFDAPPELVATYNVGPRKTGIIPLPANGEFDITALNPKFVKVRFHVWQFWRTKPE